MEVEEAIKIKRLLEATLIFNLYSLKCMLVHNDVISTEMDVYVTVGILFVDSVSNEWDSDSKKTPTSMFKILTLS